MSDPLSAAARALNSDAPVDAFVAALTEDAAWALVRAVLVAHPRSVQSFAEVVGPGAARELLPALALRALPDPTADEQRLAGRSLALCEEGQRPVGVVSQAGVVSGPMGRFPAQGFFLITRGYAQAEVGPYARPRGSRPRPEDMLGAADQASYPNEHPGIP